MADPVPLSILIDTVAASVRECADALHDSVIKSRPSDASDYAMALSSTTSAYLDLVRASTED